MGPALAPHLRRSGTTTLLEVAARPGPVGGLWPLNPGCGTFPRTESGLCFSKQKEDLPSRSPPLPAGAAAALWQRRAGATSPGVASRELRVPGSSRRPCRGGPAEGGGAGGQVSSHSGNRWPPSKLHLPTASFREERILVGRDGNFLEGDVGAGRRGLGKVWIFCDAFLF